MAEQLTLAEKIHDPSVVDELDRTFTDHPHRVRRFRALLEDLRPRREALDIRPLCEPNHGRCVQIVERRMALQERGDVAHGEHVGILPADVRDVYMPVRRGVRRRSRRRTNRTSRVPDRLAGLEAHRAA